jgi:hypothetical protein
VSEEFVTEFRSLKHVLLADEREKINKNICICQFVYCPNQLCDLMGTILAFTGAINFFFVPK